MIDFAPTSRPRALKRETKRQPARASKIFEPRQLLQLQLQSRTHGKALSACRVPPPASRNPPRSHTHKERRRHRPRAIMPKPCQKRWWPSSAWCSPSQSRQPYVVQPSAGQAEPVVPAQAGGL
ncbi:uncharacterized protein BKA78DRAFT_316989 [Phyllosticta capitalensis]|uniref:uncharacterized protein n=1 Tax=Phyllosticta capitalensis TaxID=121624 RepID=UPI00313115D6